MRVTETRIDGDFRSEDCTRLLKESDIVVTNPPFSLFRDFFKWLIDNSKDFIIVGNQNAITYKEVFPCLKDNKVWMGTGHSYSSLAGYFDSFYEDHAVTGEHKEGQIRVSGVCWFTNMDHQRRHEPLILVEKYDAEKYPKYDNYDAIEVNKTKNIPGDYFGVMGVPVSFFHKYCPEQFEILNCSAYSDTGKFGCTPLYINEKKVYARILIRRKINKK